MRRDMADSMSQFGPAGEMTVDHCPAPSQDGDQLRQVTVALVPGAGRPPPVDDLRVLLRRRLLFVALLLSAALVLTVVALSATNMPLDGWAYSIVALFAPGAVLVPVLWMGRPLSVRQLRVIELVLF